MNFEGFLGNRRTKEYLSSAFSQNAFPHALLIAGERGIGKKTLAALISRALVCSGEDKPCNKCNSCEKAKSNIHPDISFIDAEESSVDVKRIRDLKRDAILVPNDSDRKVYIIANAGALNHPSQDALLKILEEPPSFTFFILLCNSASDLLPTIVSRTAHITLSPLSDAEIASIIDKKLPELSSAERSELIRTSGGVCSFLFGEKNTVSSEISESIASALANRDEIAIFKAVSSLEKAGRDILVLALDELLLILRDAIVVSTGAVSRTLSPSPGNLAKELSHSFSSAALSELLDYVTEAKSDCPRNIGTSHITGNLICKFAYTAATAASKG